MDLYNPHAVRHLRCRLHSPAADVPDVLVLEIRGRLGGRRPRRRVSVKVEPVQGPPRATCAAILTLRALSKLCDVGIIQVQAPSRSGPWSLRGPHVRNSFLAPAGRRGRIHGKSTFSREKGGIPRAAQKSRS